MVYKAVRVFYSGTVQGVGFRYTVQELAGRLGLDGWVRNLPDRRVEMFCEGDEEKLRMLLNEIKTGVMSNYIMDAAVTWEEPTYEIDGFDIRL